MTSGNSLLPPGAPSLDEPLEMLAACHERIRAQLGTLARLAQWLPQQGADEQATRAARSVMRYFDLAAVNHHDDEERDLLPAMLDAVDAAERPRLEAVAERVVTEHDQLRTNWQELRAVLVEVAEGRKATLDEARVLQFAALYETHIRLEEDELLPWAERLLGEDAVTRISLSMTDRRRAPPQA